MIRSSPDMQSTAHTAQAASWKHIVLAHGGGGQLSDELMAQCVLPQLRSKVLHQLTDSAVFCEQTPGRIAMTIDGYVVTPWRFPGGDVGRLAVCGTVNDLAVCGARPLGLALGLILPEGLPREHLEQVMASIAAASAQAGVEVVTGDTKVVDRQSADGIYITTAGVGLVPLHCQLSPQRVQADDVLIVNGDIGTHGLAVMLAREMPEMQSVLTSDAAPLNGLIDAMLAAGGEDVHFMRDPTRGGLAALAADLASNSGMHVTLRESAIPVKAAARHAADMLGLDPLDIANEGKVVAVVARHAVPRVLAAMRGHPLGQQACVIGTVTDPRDGICELHTAIGGRRIIQKPYGEQLPRIC